MDAVIYTDLNFVQDKPPTEPSGYDACEMPATPVASVLRLLNYVDQEEPEVKFYIYEGWADAGTTIPDFPAVQPAAGHSCRVSKDSHYVWWVTLHDVVIAASGNNNIMLIPVCVILSGLLTDIEALTVITFEDSAPQC